MIEAKSNQSEVSIKLQAHGRDEIIQETVNILHAIYNSVKAAVGPEEAKTYFYSMLETIRHNIDVFMADSDTANIIVLEEEE